jgi:signal transduction histidine kinase
MSQPRASGATARPGAARLWSAPLRRDPTELAHVRRSAARLFAGHPPELVADIQLVISELVTNALTHADHGPVQVTIVRADDHVAIHVTDEGEGKVAMRDPSLDGGGGLGLHIVEAISRAWGAEPGPPTHVWARVGTADQ